MGTRYVTRMINEHELAVWQTKGCTSRLYAFGNSFSLAQEAKGEPRPHEIMETRNDRPGG